MIAKLLKRQEELIKISEKAASMIGDENGTISKLAMNIISCANDEYVEIVDMIDHINGKK